MDRFKAIHRTFGLIAAVFLLAACGGGGGGGQRNNAPAPAPAPAPPPDTGVANTFAFISTGPYAGVLRDCTYAGTETQTCTIGTLNFLGQDKPNPTINDVMERVLVSHTWMGENIRAALQQLPSDMLLMLRSVTAIVIASDIRPAFYDPETGAIYLDSAFLWLTLAQEAVVTDKEDFRSNFGDALQFKMPWRYVRNNQRLGITANPDGSRDLTELIPVLGFLLYHELAHAVDFMPQSKMASISASQSVEQAILSSSFLSSQWQSFNPLTSTQLDALADVSFAGETATATQQAIQPDELVMEFTGDGAIQYYSYLTQFEDFATMFETVMMDFHFGFKKDTGITNNTEFSNDGLVAWGQRGRLGGQGPNSRAREAIQALYAGDLAAVETFLNGLPAPTEMTVGSTWGANLTLGIQPSSNEPGMEFDIDKRVFDDILERRAIR